MAVSDPQHIQETKSNPDPTVATNDAVARAMKAERDFVNGKIETLEQRLSGIDTATKLRYDTLGDVTKKSELITEIAHVIEIIDEKFESVETQFGLIERQRVEQKKDTKDAVDAALAAAKEAVKEQTTASGLSIAKSETATTEQMKQLNATFTAALQGIGNSIDDLKERLSRIENRQLGASEQREYTREGLSSVQAILAIIVAMIVIGTGLYAATSANSPEIVPVTVTTP